MGYFGGKFYAYHSSVGNRCIYHESSLLNASEYVHMPHRPGSRMQPVSLVPFKMAENLSTTASIVYCSSIFSNRCEVTSWSQRYPRRLRCSSHGTQLYMQLLVYPEKKFTLRNALI